MIRGGKMKPSQPNIEYCIKHREFVNGLLEKRGGWEAGDWYSSKGRKCTTERFFGLVHDADWWAYPDALWLPSEGDVLAMLDGLGVAPHLSSERGPSGALSWSASGWNPSGMTGEPERSGWQPTPLIALLELVRAVEDV